MSQALCTESMANSATPLGFRDSNRTKCFSEGWQWTPKLRVPCLLLFYWVCQQHSTLLSCETRIWENVLSCPKCHFSTSLLHRDLYVYVLTLIYLNKEWFKYFKYFIIANNRHLKHSNVWIVRGYVWWSSITFPSLFFPLHVNGLLHDFIDINYTENSEITCRFL